LAQPHLVPDGRLFRGVVAPPCALRRSSDFVNFDIAGKMCPSGGTEILTMLAADDVASAPAVRRVAGAASQGSRSFTKWQGQGRGGDPLVEVVAVIQRASDGLRSMGVALSPCVLPAAGKATFDLPVGQIEIGMGIHGELGTRQGGSKRHPT